MGFATVAEIGVYEGEFAQHVLRECNTISTYFMVDPWRHLGQWNKPWNRSDQEFAPIKRTALERTEFAKGKRVVLEGTTLDVSPSLPDQGLDFAYVDGDHTLRGIMIDLIHLWPKMKDKSVLAGDDFSVSVWQHADSFEPTFVFPAAVYFAEAMGATIYGLPANQFAIVVDRGRAPRFEFKDLTSSYHPVTVRHALEPKKS